MDPAIALLEFDSVASGVEAGDAMAKKSPIARIVAGTVHPGKYLVLVGGEVADVVEALAAGMEVGAGAIVDRVFLPGVHPDVIEAMGGGRWTIPIAALGIIETHTVAAAVAAADAGLKSAEVTLLEVRLADALGGKGLVFFTGLVADVETAVRSGTDAIAGPGLLHAVVIPQLHVEIAERLIADTRWRAHSPGFRGPYAGGPSAGARP
jgi:microcompartment protein CcmL/EutN